MHKGHLTHTEEIMKYQRGLHPNSVLKHCSVNQNQSEIACTHVCVCVCVLPTIMLDALKPIRGERGQEGQSVSKNSHLFLYFFFLFI